MIKKTGMNKKDFTVIFHSKYKRKQGTACSLSYAYAQKTTTNEMYNNLMFISAGDKTFVFARVFHYNFILK